MDVFSLSWALMAAGVGIVAPSAPLAALDLGGLGLGLGPSMPNYTAYGMDVVPPAVRGRASGLLTTAYFSGQFASPLVTAPLVAQVGLAEAFGALALAMGVSGWPRRVGQYRARRTGLRARPARTLGPSRRAQVSNEVSTATCLRAAPQDQRRPVMSSLGWPCLGSRPLTTRVPHPCRALACGDVEFVQFTRECLSAGSSRPGRLRLRPR